MRRREVRGAAVRRGPPHTDWLLQENCQAYSLPMGDMGMESRGAERIVLLRRLAQDGGLAVELVLGDLLHLFVVGEHLHAPLLDLPGCRLLLVGLGELAHVVEQVAEHLRDLLPLLATLLVGLLGHLRRLLHSVADAEQRNLLRVRGDHPAVVFEDRAAPVERLAVQVGHRRPGLLGDEGAGRVVGEALRGGAVVEAVPEVPDHVSLAAREPTVLQGAVEEVELRVVRSEDLADALGVPEDVLAGAGAHGDAELLGTQEVVEAVVAALDLVADIELDRRPLEAVLALVDPVVPLHRHQLRPRALARGGEEHGAALAHGHGAADVVEREHGASDGTDDGLPVLDQGQGHAVLLVLQKLPRGVDRHERPVGLGQLPAPERVDVGAGVPGPPRDVLRGRALDDAVVGQEGRDGTGELLVSRQQVRVLLAQDRDVRELLL
mmetsp:Transcript_12184/g.32175  ORF Transcript_12184/g.32175 Transcript_12184/m.32175 type:complete len:436 (+) Transcript_12184:112-1419(+)